MSSIKACPFCGSEHVVYRYDRNNASSQRYTKYEENAERIECYGCHIVVRSINYPSSRKIMNKWNERSDPKIPG